MDHGKVERLAKVVWCALLVCAVGVSIRHVDPWVSAPAALFLLGGIGLWTD